MDRKICGTVFHKNGIDLQIDLSSDLPRIIKTESVIQISAGALFMCADAEFWFLAIRQLHLAKSSRIVSVVWNGCERKILFIEDPMNEDTKLDFRKAWTVADLTEDLQAYASTSLDKMTLEREASARSLLHDLQYKLCKIQVIASSQKSQNHNNERIIKQAGLLSKCAHEIDERIKTFRDEFLSNTIRNIVPTLLDLILAAVEQRFDPPGDPLVCSFYVKRSDYTSIVSTNFEFAVDAISYVVMNAIEAYTDNSLQLETSQEIKLYTRSVNQDFISLVVEDYAGGVPEFIRDNMFFGAISGKNNPEKHPGNGLRYASRIMTLMGGKLSYEPSDAGSRFIFDFPLERSP